MGSPVCSRSDVLRRHWRVGKMGVDTVGATVTAEWSPSEVSSPNTQTEC